MCLLVLAWQTHPRYRLIVAANRDEFHERPAAALAKWSAPPHILGGRDLRAGGAWLALDAVRRFGVVTNFRDLQPPTPGAPSRGALIPAFLSGSEGAGDFLHALEPAAAYSGFNLLLADERELWYASNRAAEFARLLPPGVYGLSNHLLDTPWPKLARVRARFRTWLDADDDPHGEQLLAMLSDRTPAAPEGAAQSSGLAPEWERVLSAPFVLHPRYGTRCSTVVLLGRDGALYVRERCFAADGRPDGDTALDLPAGQWP
jgi:uncharacterized protein with NRDE domain